MALTAQTRRLIGERFGDCHCASRLYPHFDPACSNPVHQRLADLDVADRFVSPQADGDSTPFRMTLAAPTIQIVWLLWKNDHCLAVYGDETRAMHEMNVIIEGIPEGFWRAVPNTLGRRWTNDLMSGARVVVEPRGVR